MLLCFVGDRGRGVSRKVRANRRSPGFRVGFTASVENHLLEYLLGARTVNENLLRGVVSHENA